MKIGIDAIPLAQSRTGIGHYTLELARGLAQLSPADEFELLAPVPTLDLTDNGDAALPQNLRVVQAKINQLRKRWWSIGLPLYLGEAQYELFHGTNYNVPLWKRCRTVVSIHDLSLLLHPETHEEHLVRRARRRLPTMARVATMIITPSEAVKRELCEHLDVSPSKVAVTPEAARRNFRPAKPERVREARRRLEVEDEFLLFVGTIEPRKNLITLVRAFEEVLRIGSWRPQLVIAGKEGWLTDDLFAYINKTGLKERIKVTGYITDEDLRALYSSCEMCIYPSLYEGFGLPTLEAMACGAPVITSRTASLVETVGDAARLIDPRDVNDLARAIIELHENEAERRHFAEAGLRRAHQFTWERTAAMTKAVYEEAMKR